MQSDSRLMPEWNYRPVKGFHDEMLEADGTRRPHWAGLVDALNRMAPEGLDERWQEGRRLIRDNGVTYNVYGDPRSTERPWPLDPVPYLIDTAEWTAIEAAIVQRATLLNTILGDLYGPQRILRERRIPPALIFEHPNYFRACRNLPVPNGTWLHNYAVDIARSPNGNWWVLADRTQAPSGAGYALENRLVSLRVLPEVFGSENVRRLASFFQAYRTSMRALAPRVENPRVVLLTPGPYNETYFEHAFLARYLGYTLVEGGDLTVRNNRVYLKTLGGLLPVDVIVRRQDDVWCDPLALRPDSMLGVPGLVEAAWAGNVAIANALGSGVLESAAYSAFLPALSRHILGEDLKMPNIATWWCGDPGPRKWVVDHLSNLVIKPASRALQFEPVFGASLSAAERKALLEKIEANPGAYVAQEQVSLSMTPVAIFPTEESAESRLDARHLVLRVFAVAANGSYMVMPGGLSRITSSIDSLVVSMQHGGGSKDTWVLADAPEPAFSLLRTSSAPLPVSRATFDLPSRVADNLFWLGRYLERLEMAVRTARAVPPRLYHDPDPAGLGAISVSWRVLAGGGWLRSEDGRALADAEFSRVKPGERAELLEREVLELLCGEESRFGLRAAMKDIQHLAWLLRDVISADSWRVLKQLEQQFLATPPEGPLLVSWAQNLLNHTVISLSAFSGLISENMTRGNGWRFLDMGRRLERAHQTLQLVRNGLGFEPGTNEHALAAVLEVADSTLTYRSRYLNSMQADLVLDLLLLDEGNPRSAAFQLARLREHVADLPESRPSTGNAREVRLTLGMLAAVQTSEAHELAKANDEGHLSSLDTLTSKLIADLLMLSETVTRVYFTHAIASRQLASR